MSSFPRIDKDHPLTTSAREVNAYSEEHGLEETLEHFGLNVGLGELAYLAEQRAIRAVAGSLGYEFGGKNTTPEKDEEMARAIVSHPVWEASKLVLIGSYMDGMVIGFRAAQIAAPPGQ